MPSTNTFHMPHKCIYLHMHKVFVMWNRFQAYKGDMNIYGPLWTPTHICAIWIYFPIILYILHIFPFSFLPKKTLPLPMLSTIIWQTFSITTASCMSSPPYTLLFVTQSPVICKDYFSLFYMYKLSRYYPVFNIDLCPMFPQSTCNSFTLLSRFSLITIELEPDVLINGVLNDSCDGLW